jgi:hypothetical protein
MISYRLDSAGIRQMDALKLPNGWLTLSGAIKISPDGSWLIFQYDNDTIVPDVSLRKFENLMCRLNPTTGKMLGWKKIDATWNANSGSFTGDNKYFVFCDFTFIGGRWQAKYSKFALSELDSVGGFVQVKNLRTLEQYPDMVNASGILLGQDGALHLFWSISNRNDSLIHSLVQLKNPSDPVSDWIFQAAPAPVPPGQYTDTYRSNFSTSYDWWKSLYPRRVKRIAINRPLKQHCAGLPVVFASQNGYLADSVQWDFGDGKSTVTKGNEAVHVYEDSGVYRVKAFFFRRDLRDTMEYILRIFPFNKPNLGKDTLLCAGQALSVSGRTNYAIAYRWEHGGQNPDIRIDTAGSWVLWVETAHCLGSDTLRTEITDCHFKLNEPCEGDSLRLGFPASQYQADSISVYYQSSSVHAKPDTTLNILLPAAVYSAVFTRFKNQLSRSDSLFWVVHSRPRIHIGNDTLLCADESMILRLPPGLQSPQWNTGDTNTSIRIIQPGIYVLEASDGRCSNTDSINVLKVNCSVRMNGACAGDTTKWSFEAGADSIYWEESPGNIQTFSQLPEIKGILYTSEGRYRHMTTWYYHGLQTSRKLHADIFTAYEPFPEDSLSLCRNTWLDVTQITSDARYLWADGMNGPSRKPVQDGWYYLSVRKGDCFMNDSIQVRIENCTCPLFMPNAIYLESDFDNHLLVPQFGCERPNYRLQVFNRWGQQLFEGDWAWDGTFKGQPVQEGIYIWQLQFKDPLSEQPRNEKGTVLFLR